MVCGVELARCAAATTAAVIAAAVPSALSARANEVRFAFVISVL